MTWVHGRLARKAIQIIFFALFVLLLFSIVEKQVTRVSFDFFFRINPLSAIGVMLASRSWIPRLGWAFLIVGLTLLAGRAWCGWICPFGTLLEWISFRKARKRATLLSPHLRKIKYFVLVILLITAFFGSTTLLTIEPLALFTRTMTTAIIPGLIYAINTVEEALYPIALFQPALDGVESLLRGTVLPVKQPVFDQNLWIAALFVTILALNALADRFWCRYLCPLGALLGLLSRVAILRLVVGAACNHCTRCALQCRLGAISTSKAAVIIQPCECTVCLDCLAECKKTDLHFQPVLNLAPPQEFDLSRREAFGALATGAAGLLLLRTGLHVRNSSPLLIRPPGAGDEQAFLSSCLRCSQCIRICPTSGLQLALNQAGLEGLWTPVLVPRAGYCDYSCHACGQVCPSGAIPALSLADKRLAVIGKAYVKRDRCLPWASNMPCIVCEEMCPTPEKSIHLEEVTVTNLSGEAVFLQRPYVIRERCTGCGICEYHCPLEGEAGIRVAGYPED